MFGFKILVESSWLIGGKEFFCGVMEGFGGCGMFWMYCLFFKCWKNVNLRMLEFFGLMNFWLIMFFLENRDNCWCN